MAYAGNLKSLEDLSSSKKYFFENVDISYRKEVERIIKEKL